jgi:hypothetical protein
LRIFVGFSIAASVLLAAFADASLVKIINGLEVQSFLSIHLFIKLRLVLRHCWWWFDSFDEDYLLINR